MLATLFLQKKTRTETMKLTNVGVTQRNADQLGGIDPFSGLQGR